MLRRAWSEIPVWWKTIGTSEKLSILNGGGKLSAEEMTMQKVEDARLISTLRNLALPCRSLVVSWNESTLSMRKPPVHWLPGTSSSLMQSNWSMSRRGQWKASEEAG